MHSVPTRAHVGYDIMQLCVNTPFGACSMSDEAEGAPLLARASSHPPRRKESARQSRTTGSALGLLAVLCLVRHLWVTYSRAQVHSTTPICQPVADVGAGRAVGCALRYTYRLRAGLGDRFGVYATLAAVGHLLNATIVTTWESGREGHVDINGSAQSGPTHGPVGGSRVAVGAGGIQAPPGVRSDEYVADVHSIIRFPPTLAFVSRQQLMQLDSVPSSSHPEPKPSQP